MDWRVRWSPLRVCCSVHFLRPEVGSVGERRSSAGGRKLVGGKEDTGE